MFLGNCVLDAEGKDDESTDSAESSEQPKYKNDSKISIIIIIIYTRRGY